MEINKYTDIIGVVACDDVVEGRMVILTSQSSSYDFGSRADLFGARVPADDTEAALAKYIITWPVNNAKVTDDIKMLVPMPSYDWSLRRGGWDQAGNVPFTSKIYLTYPGNQDGQTIPSGYLALAFDRGVFTVPSGAFVFSAGITSAGAPLEVLNVADDDTDAGKLAYNAAGTIAIVERYDSEKNTLTFRTL
jgi:hypothetical protein